MFFKPSLYLFYWPIVYSLWEPAQDRVPVGKVGLLLGYVSLAVRQHISQDLHKMAGLLFKDFLIKVAQVNQVAYQTWERCSNKVKIFHKIQWSCHPHTTLNKWKCKNIFNKITIPSKHSVWLPSRHTQMSEHCSSLLRNKMNFRRRSCVCIDAIHCWDRDIKDIKSYSLITKMIIPIIYERIFTSGVSTLRWDTTAGTDMMWMRNDLSRLSEKWAAMTGLKNIRLR